MRLKYNIATLFLVLAGLQSCSLLGPIDDIEPSYVLTDGSGDVIIDESTAEMALNGMYASLRNRDIADCRRPFAGLAHMNKETFQVSSNDEFMSGVITDRNLTLENMYTTYYNIINHANSFLNNLEIANLTDISDIRHKEMISEARCIRALCNMMLLRCFGQYNDMDSECGIVLNEAPVASNEAKARASVKDVYTSIMNDLEYAVLNGPKGSEVKHYRISALFAKALKARMLLNFGDNESAAVMAGEVLSEAAANGFGLEANYMDVFQNQFNSSEMLFAPYISISTSPKQTIAYVSINFIKPGKLLEAISKSATFRVAGEADPRFTNVFPYDERCAKYLLNQQSIDDINSYYFMRLAEVYFIKAEAEARKGTSTSYQAARAALLEVIERIGYDEDYVNSIPDTKLLEVILKHKLLELNTENCEEWFDMVRYHRNGDFESWSNEDKKLLPPFTYCIFPLSRTIRGGNNLLEQPATFN